MCHGGLTDAPIQPKISSGPRSILLGIIIIIRVYLVCAHNIMDNNHNNKNNNHNNIMCFFFFWSLNARAISTTRATVVPGTRCGRAGFGRAKGVQITKTNRFGMHILNTRSYYTCIHIYICQHTSACVRFRRVHTYLSDTVDLRATVGFLNFMARRVCAGHGRRNRVFASRPTNFANDSNKCLQ